MKLYLDEDLSPTIAQILCQRGVDAVSTHEVGMVGAPAREQLEYAARESRALVARNARRFRALADESVRAQRPHAGIILCPPRFLGSEFAAIAGALQALVGGHREDLGPYDLLYLSRP